MHSFKGKIAFVTGGTSGIGRATAVAFARAGALVAVVGRREAEGQKTLDLLQEAGGDGNFVMVDLKREADVIGAIEHAVSRFGQIDFAANCAGVDLNAGLVDYTGADFDAIFAVNVKGFFCMKHQILAMKNKGGVIIGRPDDVANAIIFLCSSSASFVTAASLNVDGGFALG